ncbi:GAF domain-containing protein [Chitinivorax tropicus]|uniref:GAF domain-containing protein n=1 Tax=Chitinivorax tropicus TaxID=714531 RepID=A0A840MMN4_9PROT|nr:GAF domain-containing protein [Chitinivorax tropicus]MBB5017766.1 GAF domain-containing protein [Chitinivorax tropicus]
MFEVITTHEIDAVDYDSLASQLTGLLSGERNFVANSAQFSAFIYQALPVLNWAGFYFYDGQELVLGPFQGKVACVRIPLGRGVCGTSAQQRQTIRVPDVHAFDGHIACDSASNAEIVLPIIKDGQLVGVLDIDSPLKDRFSEHDQAGLERLLGIYLDGTDFPM